MTMMETYEEEKLRRYRERGLLDMLEYMAN